jgi:DNA-directed RNA polymerase specialized sigma24 family protein
MSRSPSQPHDDSLARFAASMAADTAEVDAATMHDAMAGLRRYLRKRFPAIRSDDLDDLAADAVARVVARSRSGALEQHPNLAGYLVRTVERLALDYLGSARINRELTVLDDVLAVQLPDHKAAAAFDKRATVDLVHAVLRRIQHSRDATLFQITTHMLNEIQLTGVVPSNRKIAQACGLSHTAVAKALQRLRQHVTALTDEEPQR